MAKRDFRDAIETRPEPPLMMNDDLGQLERRVAEGEPRRVAPKHRQCPRCHEGAQNGVGQCDGTYKKASSLTRRYFKCDRCGHTWIVDFTPEQVRDLPDDGLPAKPEVRSE
jgi:ribosomal protein S27AE